MPFYEMIVSVLLLVLISVFFGILVGLKAGRKKRNQEVSAAYDKARQEAREEKVHLSAELHQELGKIKQSIISSAEAYQSAVQAIDERFCPPLDTEARHIETPVRKQLELLFESTPQDRAEQIGQSDQSSDDS